MSYANYRVDILIGQAPVELLWTVKTEKKVMEKIMDIFFHGLLGFSINHKKSLISFAAGASIYEHGSSS